MAGKSLSKPKRFALAMFCGAVSIGAPGCATLLPRANNQEPSRFSSYEAARATFEQIVPYQTSLEDLSRLGFKVDRSANLERIPYPQWINWLMGQNAPHDEADPGIRDCMAAQVECQAYVFRFSRVDSERRGSFLADFFNFKRNTYVHGWRFEGTVLVRGHVVLFRTDRGQPWIELYENRTNPLGPFQSMGDGVMGSMLSR